MLDRPLLFIHQRAAFSKKSRSMSDHRLIKDIEPPNYEALYHRLVRLREELPWHDLRTPKGTGWLGRAVALVEAVWCTAELATLRGDIRCLTSPLFNAPNALVDTVPHAIAVTIDTVIAKVELKLPADAQSAFIPAGGVLDAFQAVAKAVETAESDVLFIDPWADEVLVRDFVCLVPEHVQIRMMDDASKPQPSLKPAAERWIAQYPTRPLQVRRAPARALHDRLIVTDGKAAYTMGQSFNHLVKRSPSYLQRMNQEAGALKISAYEAIWASATPLV
jgi:hypothetical protein